MARQPGEFVKRAAFALIASLALHDKKGADKPFLESLRSSSVPPPTNETLLRRE